MGCEPSTKLHGARHVPKRSVHICVLRRSFTFTLRLQMFDTNHHLYRYKFWYMTHDWSKLLDGHAKIFQTWILASRVSSSVNVTWAVVKKFSRNFVLQQRLREHKGERQLIMSFSFEGILFYLFTVDHTWFKRKYNQKFTQQYRIFS